LLQQLARDVDAGDPHRWAHSSPARADGRGGADPRESVAALAPAPRDRGRGRVLALGYAAKRMMLRAPKARQ